MTTDIPPIPTYTEVESNPGTLQTFNERIIDEFRGNGGTVGGPFQGANRISGLDGDIEIAIQRVLNSMDIQTRCRALLFVCAPRRWWPTSLHQASQYSAATCAAKFATSTTTSTPEALGRH
ncbi:hypothetical protein JNN96_13045 [Mycobacterium sp. DSM 3803]|nr:hypothetical protein [Mycobacterium sp. DSM 3803]OKH80667.1 hypothetical protein EB73_33190 [Mycobacterium sp. SWH-M3]